jgi:hypothetical protein
MDTLDNSMLACAAESEQFLKNQIKMYGADTVAMVNSVYGVNLLCSMMTQKQAEVAVIHIVEEFYNENQRVIN